MIPPSELIKRGVTLLPCVGDGRQSGTSASPSILNASPESAVGGGLAILKTGDRVRFDLTRRRADMLVPEEELARRRREWKAVEYINQTPWQELHRRYVGQLEDGACLDFSVKYQRVAETHGIPRDNH
jgi:dihydroxy-acid dehydratase